MGILPIILTVFFISGKIQKHPSFMGYVWSIGHSVPGPTYTGETIYMVPVHLDGHILSTIPVSGAFNLISIVLYPAGSHPPHRAHQPEVKHGGGSSGRPRPSSSHLGRHPGLQQCRHLARLGIPMVGRP